MHQDKNKSYESVSVTPVIKDMEVLIARVFQFFTGVIKWILSLFNGFISLTITHIRLVVVVVLLGGVLGYLSIYAVPRNYKSGMVLTSLLGNNQQLYTDVHYFESLVKNQNWATLSEVLEISIESAKKITGFEIFPHGTDLEKIRSLSNIYNEVDSVTWSFIDFDELMDSETPDLFSNHRIVVHSINPQIFKQIEPKLLTYFERAKHLQKSSSNLKKTYLDRKKALLIRMKDLAKLQEVYYKVMVLQAEKKESSSVTNVSMGTDNAAENQDMLALFGKYDEYQGELNFINKKLLLFEKYYRVIAQFSPEGRKEFLGGKGRAVVLGFIFYLLFILFLSAQKAFYRRNS